MSHFTPHILNRIEREKFTVEFAEQHFVFIRLKEGVEIDLDCAKEQNRILREHGKIGEYLIFTDPGKHTTFTKEARDYSNTEEATEVYRALAVLVTNMPHRIIANFMIQFYKNLRSRMKAFSSEEQAVNWLQTFVAAEVGE